MSPQLTPANDDFWQHLVTRVRGTELILLLERWARGAGMRSWYALRDVADVEAARNLVRPGSSLTAYLHPNLPIQGLVSPKVVEEARGLLDALREHGELIALIHGDRPPALEVEYIADVAELEGWARDALGKEALIGEYPDWLPDGENAISAVVPDSDGVVRAHPY